VGQRGAHLHPQIPFLGAVGFVYHDDDVFAVVQQGRIVICPDIAEFEDGGDDDFAGVLAQQGFQRFAAVRFDQVGDVGSVEGGADLGVQVDAVDDDEHSGVTQGRLEAHLLRGKD